MGEWLYRAALVGIVASAALTFAILLFFSAPYGRHSRKGWGVTLDPRWAWIIMEAPSFLVMAAMALFGHSLDGASISEGPALSLLFFCLWELHYAYRSFIYPFRIRNTNKHPFPLVLITMVILFNSANAYVNGWWLFASGFSYGSSWLTDARFIVGIALFTIANLLPRALSNHSWYLESFPDYPKERKALIPFIL